MYSAVAVSFALALTLASCSSAPEPAPAPEPTEQTSSPQSFDELIEAAKSEGSLRVYSSLPEGDQKKLDEGFTAKYGIEVESLRLGGNTLPTRFETETTASTPSGEVLLSTALDFLLTETEAGTLVPFEDSGVPDALEDLPEAATLDDYAGIPVFQILNTGFIYNTDQVADSDIPATWGEFVASDVSAKACSVSPDSSETLMIFMASLRASDGDDVLRGLGERISRWYPSVVPMNEAVASGECAVGLNSAEFFTHAMKGQGAPVEFKVAASATHPVVGGAVAAKAEHPNAARLFLHYALSEDGGTALQNPPTGSFGAYHADQFPSNLAVMSPEDQRKALDDTAEVMKLLGF